MSLFSSKIYFPFFEKIKVMFWWINVQDNNNAGAILLTLFTVGCIGHVIYTFSALGRMVMATSAMGHTPILPLGDEEELLPHQLTNVLLTESRIARHLQTPCNKQYRHNQAIIEEDSEGCPLTYETSLRRRYPDIALVETIV